MTDYDAFVRKKLSMVPPTGLASVPDLARYAMFPHQNDLVRWSLMRGRAAIFADTGLGKSRMQVAWADCVQEDAGGYVLILAPLAVAQQTVQEGANIGVVVHHVRDGSEITKPGIYITNYDRLHRFDCRIFGAVVLDESGRIKHHDTKTLAILIEEFRYTKFKLCATATPAPNDWAELGTHAEFLGICRRVEMLAEFFTHDGGDTSKWRLKGHARKAFWQWVAVWGALIRNPSDLGYSDDAYNLPPLLLYEHKVTITNPETIGFFTMEAQTLSERRTARRASINERVAACAEICNTDAGERWVVWAELNDEGNMLTAAIDGAVQIAGSDSTEVKEQRLQDFADGKIRVLVSKCSIAGFGLNWAFASRMAFVGVTDSFEAYYQAVRRQWRFGQKREVHVHIFSSAAEGAVVDNLKRKEADALEMAESLSAETRGALKESVVGLTRQSNPYCPKIGVTLPQWLTN